MAYLHRTLEPVVQKAVEDFAAVVLTGPRQSGKTTLLRHLFADQFTYVSLDLVEAREVALDDPRGFLDAYPPPLIVDEAQSAPELFPYLRARIDEHRDLRGQYIISGSQNFQLLEKITESLAGRAAILRLFPFTQGELHGAPDRAPVWRRSMQNTEQTGIDLWAGLLRGFYPEIATWQVSNLSLWLSSYVQTYLQRDVRSLARLGDFGRFEDFLRVVAGRSGNLLNYSEMSREMGVAVNTIKSWIGVLQASYQVLLLRPWHDNINKELTRTPKLYMTDTGLMCALLGLRDRDELLASPYAGAVLETAVVNEVQKSIAHRGEQSALHFWRTAAGTEVDLLVQVGDERIAIEVKKTSTPRKKHTSSIRQLMEDLPDKVKRGYLIHAGEQVLPAGRGVKAIPFTSL